MPPSQQFFLHDMHYFDDFYIITLVNWRSPQLRAKVYNLYRPVLHIDESTEFAYLENIPSQ